MAGDDTRRALDATAAEETPPVRFRGHLPALDGVRGLAILLVLFHHLWPYEWSNPITSALTRVSHAGWIGVDLFFVLSGFLITGILIDTRGRERYFRTFIARRSLRIFPLYFLFLGIAFGAVPAIVAWLGHPDPILEENRRALPWFLAYMSNHISLLTDPALTGAVGADLVHGVESGVREFLAITWSLSVEEQFYLVWPAVVLVFARQLHRVAIVLIAAAIASRAAAYLTLAHWPHVTNMALLCRMDSLVVGAALAAWLRSDRFRPEALRRTVRLALPALGAPLVLYLALDGGRRNPAFAIAGYTVAALFFGALVASLLDDARRRGPARRVFESGFLRFFGKYSYGLYIYHMLIFYLLDLWRPAGLRPDGSPADPEHFAPYFGDSVWDAPVRFALATSLSVVVAWLSFHAFEKPFLRLKRFFEPPRRRDPPEGTPRREPRAVANAT